VNAHGLKLTLMDDYSVVLEKYQVADGDSNFVKNQGEKIAEL